MSLPALLLVPGAWHQPAHFGLLEAELPDIDVRSVRLASNGDDPAALGDMYADADVIAAAASAIDGPVVAVAHSYGGIPTTQALANADNVERMIYVAAFQLDAGESALSSLGGSLAPWCSIQDLDGAAHHVEVLNPVEVFYHDVDAVIAERAVSQLRHQAYRSFVQEVDQVGWRSKPSTYVVCEADNAIPSVVQERFARRATEIVRMDSSHSPFLSQPAALAKILRDELTARRGRRGPAGRTTPRPAPGVGPGARPRP